MRKKKNYQKNGEKMLNSELFSVLSVHELRNTFYEAYYQHVKKFVLHNIKCDD
jgi:hypothetical protein